MSVGGSEAQRLRFRAGPVRKASNSAKTSKSESEAYERTSALEPQLYSCKPTPAGTAATLNPMSPACLHRP